MTLGELRAQRNGGGITLGELRQRRFGSQPSTEKEEEQGLIDFVLDNLAAGTGRSLESLGQIVERVSRPENMLPDEWREKMSQENPLAAGLASELQDVGSRMYDRNARQYEDNSLAYHAANILQSTPETLAILAGSAAIGGPIGTGLSALGRVASTGLSQLPRYGDLAWKAAKAYENSKIAKTLLPTSATSFAAQETGAFMEAESEKQQAINRHIETAKQNGTYIPNQTELEAEQIGDKVFWDNVGIISAFNTPQYNALYGRPAKGLLGNLGRMAVSAGSEGAEEVAQEAASAYERGEPLEWRDIRDAGIAGLGMGAIFHGAGRAANYGADRQQEQLDEMRKTAAQNYSNFIGGVAQNENDETGYDSNARYGQFRQEVQNALDQNTYRGENGDGEGKYWVRNPNMNVSTEGMRPESLNALDMLGKYYFDYTGKPLILNAGTNGDHAAGEFSHANGWKFDAIDQLEGDGPLITANYDRGPFLDQFIKYGRSLGLGMNFEGEGTQNVHLDVAVDGTQWDGNGEHAGGFNPRGANDTSQKSPKQGNSIDNFMHAIGEQESDGNYDLTNTDSGAAGKFQIMPDNWSSWAQDAGLSPNAPMTPENQELVARNKMQEYYNKFGNWRDVAIAWYGGEGAVSYSEEAKNRPQYSNGNRYPSINEYADSVMARFEKFGGEVESLPQWNDYRRQQSQPPQQQEQTKPPFDINAEDETTQKLLDKFANERFNEAINNEDAEGIKFFDGMFADVDRVSTFQNTPENRNAVIERYGEELSKFIQDNAPAETQAQIQPTAQPVTNTENAKQTDNPYQRNAAIKNTANNFLEQLRAEGDQNKGATLFKLQNALNKGNFAEVENILKQNNVAISQIQQAQPAPIQQNPVKENKPTENILTQPTAAQPQVQPVKLAGIEKLINRASKAVTKKTSHEGKKKIGDAILQLANQSGIAVPAVDFKSLQNGSSKKIAEWQAKLSQAGAFAISSPQTSISSKTSANETVESKTAQGTTVFTPQSVIQAEEQKKNSLKYRAQQVLNKLSAQHMKNVLREREADLSNDETNEAVPFDYSNYVNDDEASSPAELQRQENEKVIQKYQAEQEKKRQERAAFDAAVKKNSENNYGLMADDARRRRERYEATRVDPITARGNFLSDLREDEVTLREEERREDEEAQQVSPETLRENYARAQYLGDFDTNERLENLREEGRKQRDFEIEQLKTANRDARKATGKEVLRTLRNPKYNAVKSKVDATSGLSTALENGSVEAIRQVRNLIAEIDNQELQERQRQAEEQHRRDETRRESLRQEEEQQRTREHAAPLEEPTIQDQPSNIKEYHASDYDTHVVFHGRKSPDAPERPTDGKSIADALKAIVQAPAGTRIEGKYMFQVEPDVFEIKDRAGRKMIGGVDSRHRPVVLNPANAYKFFGNAREVRVIYPEEKNETPIQPSEVTTPESTTESQEGGISQNNTVANPDNAEVSDNKSAQQSEETNETEDLFVVGEGQYSRNGERYYTAKVDSSKLPLGRLGDIADYLLRRRAERYSQQDKFSRGAYKFSSAQARDSFIKDVKNTQILPQEVEFQRPFSKIFNDAKKEVYRILEADKYPEIKDWIDRRMANQIDTIVMTGDIEKARELVEGLVKSTKSYKDAGNLANGVLYENLNKWEKEKRGTNRRLSGKLNEKYSKAEEIIKEYTEQYKKGEVTIEDACEDLNHFLKTGRRRKATKHSIQGEVDTTIDNFVDDKDLTPQQKLQQDFGNKLGVQTVFFNNENGDFHGAHANGTSYINVNSKMPISKVFWHESSHWLKSNNVKLYDELAKAAGITDAQRDAYLKETGRTDLITDEEIDEEILADQFEDVAKRSGLLQSIAGKNRGLIQRVVQWLKDTMNKFIDHFRNPSGKLTTKQSIALADEFGRIAKDLVDPNGQKIFHYNNRTKNIEPIGGRSSSESVRNSSEPKPPPAGAKIKYSIGNDNSNESLIDKIKNKLSWFSGDKKTIRRKKVITAKLRELSGYRILYGNVKGANDIVVDHMQKLIQSRNTYDWNKLLPVVSKEIAKNLNLNPTAEQSNLIADWLLTGALNNTSAEMKAFQKAMRDNPAMADILLETRNLFQEIADMPADEQISSSLVDLKSKPFFEGDFTEEVLDDLSPFQKIVDTAIKNVPPEVAELIKRNVNPKQLAQLSRGSGAIADIMVNGKASELEKIRAMLSEKYTGVYFDKFKPINAIIKSVGGDWKGLQTYAVAKLSKEMYEYNRAHPELETPLIPYTTEAAADATIKQGEAKFGEAQKDLVRYSKILLAMEHDSGLITDKTFYRVLNSWKNYVPMAQVFDENEDYTKLDYLKRRKGHEGDTWSPIQIMIANTHKRIQACERNKVKLELANLVRFGGFDSNLSEVASSNPDADNIIRFRENGKIKYLETPDPAIKRAVDSLQSKSDGTWIIKMLRAITSFMRMRLTGGNLDFAAGNIFRDLPDAYIHNNQLGKDVFIIGDFMRAWGSAVKELIQDARGKGMSQDLIDWEMSGGAQASFVSGDVDYIQRSIDEATSTRLQRYRRKPFMQLLDDMQKLSEFTESVTRLTTYKLAKDKLAQGRAATITDKQLAALAAREASVDFAKAGRSTRKVNQVVLFANAAVQSLNLWIEAGKEFKKGNTKPLFGKLFRAAAHGVLMAALQAAIAHAGDDDDKKAYEQAPNWEKETYWIFPSIKNPITDSGLRIPKGFDFGMRFMANLTDETIGAAFDNKPFEGKRFWETFKGALPSLTATILSPAIEAYSNYSFFREAPIVPLREQHLDAEAQYDANTSSVAKAFGQMTGWSPRKIDYMINGYFGFMGRFATNPSTDPDKFPMVRRFVFEPYKNPKIVKEYYEAYEEQTSHYNTYKLTKEKPEDFDPALYKRLKAANETMRKISNRERAIQNDENLSYTERRAKLVELEKKRVALCEKVFNKAR